MKTNFSLLALLCLHFAYGFGQTTEAISLSPANKSVTKLIQEIEAQTNLSFAYSLDLINTHYTACNCEVKNASIEKTLTALFQNSQIAFEQTGQQVTLFYDPKKAVPTFNLHGYISDSKTGEKLIGANVVNLSNQQGTTSNEYGYFNFTQNVQSLEIAASYIGYKPFRKTIHLFKDQQISIELEPALELEEIVVTAREAQASQRVTEMSQVTLEMREIKSIPNLAGEVDVLRAFQLMPGVATATEGNTGMYVRGGGPDQNLFLLDDVPLYHPTHLLGFLSVFNEDAINKATLIKGGFPARYGGRLSSVIDVRTKDGNTERLKGSINLGLISSKVSLDGPLGGQKTSFNLSARTTYLGPLINALYKQSEDYDIEQGNDKGSVTNSLNYNFRDINAKITHQINDRNKVFASFLTGSDNFKSGREEIGEYNTNQNLPYQLEDKEEAKLKWGNTIASLRWNRIYESGWFSKVNLIYGRYHYESGISQKQQYETDIIDWTDTRSNAFETGIVDIGLKVDFQKSIQANHDLRFGAGSIHHSFNVGLLKVDESLTDASTGEDARIDTLYGASKIKALESYVYIEDHISINEALSLNLGLHASAFNVQGEMYSSLQPRLLARYQFGPRMAFKGSFTLMQQYLHLLTRTGVGLPNDLWVPPTKNIKPQKSRQFALGYVFNISPTYELSMEAYHKKMNNLLSYAEGVDYLNLDDSWEEKVVQGKGNSYGVELLLKKKLDRFTGWIGYTLSKSTRNFDDINEGRQFLYKYDRRHDLSLVASYQINDKISINANWIYASGTKVTFALAKYNFHLYGETVANMQHVEERNNLTLPATHRLDLSVNFSKEKKNGKRVWTFGAYNAYNQSNPVYLDVFTGFSGSTVQGMQSFVEQGTRENQLVKQGLLPIIPSINYTRTF